MAMRLIYFWGIFGSAKKSIADADLSGSDGNIDTDGINAICIGDETSLKNVQYSYFTKQKNKNRKFAFSR